MSDVPRSSSVDSHHDYEGDDNLGCAENGDDDLHVGRDCAYQHSQSENECPKDRILVPDPRDHQGPQEDKRTGTKILKSGTLVLDSSTSDSSDACSQCDGEGEDKTTFVLSSPADQSSNDDSNLGTEISKSGTLVLDSSTSDSSDACSQCGGEGADKPTFVLGSPSDQSSNDDSNSGTKIPKSGTLVLDSSTSDTSDASSQCDGEGKGKPTFVLGSPADQGPYADRDPDMKVPKDGTLASGVSTCQPSGSFPESEEVRPNRPTLTLGAAVDDHEKTGPAPSGNREITPGDVGEHDLKRLSDEAVGCPDSRALALSEIRACLLGASTDPKDQVHSESDCQRPDKPTFVLGTPAGARPRDGSSTEWDGMDNRALQSEVSAVRRPCRDCKSDDIQTEKPTHVLGTPEKIGAG